MTEPDQRRRAERLILAELRRFHRREPASGDVRVDTLIAALHAAPRRPASHRGAAPLELTDGELRSIVDHLVAEGAVSRIGHRVRLAGDRVALGASARDDADRLMAELAANGASPPPADAVARRLGVAAWIVDALRASGELVVLAPRVEYPRTVLESLLARFEGRGLSVAEIRDELATSRRYASALHAALERDTRGVR